MAEDVKVESYRESGEDVKTQKKARVKTILANYSPVRL